MIYLAPVQGHTDAAWRHFHHEIYGGDHTYYTPFIRNEKGGFRDRDMKDFTSELNKGLTLVPQVIFKDMEELRPLLAGLSDAGAESVDLNMGCPFPLQTARGRGAAFVGNREELEKLPAILMEFPQMKFSVKMRLGYSDPNEWRNAIDVLNALSLDHVTLHPRVAKEQYGGELHYDEFADFLKASVNPVVFNGEIKTPEDYIDIRNRFPEAKGFMLGRGALGRPSLPEECAAGKTLDKEDRIGKMMLFHGKLLKHYESVLCGDSQILSKIKPFWEYAEEEIGRKAWKAIKKASNRAKYNSAVAMI